jgi:hypothetical protein
VTNTILRTCAALLAVAAIDAQAFQVASVSPRGEVSRVRQVVIGFDDAAVNFGNSQAEAPATLSCSDAQVTKGSGRWVSDRRWTFEFENDLPAGVTCSVQLREGLKSVKGVELTGMTRYPFSTGGPFVQNIQPYTGNRIDEEQFFVLRLNGDATRESVQANVWCAVEGLGERVAVRLVDGKDRTDLLKSLGQEADAAREPLRFVTLACNRTLTPSSKVELVFGKGVRTPPTGNNAQGIANTVEKRFRFQVRESFTASFSCERENAQSGCLPIRPMQLNFNAPVPAKMLAEIRLKSDRETIKPDSSALAQASGDDGVLDSITFKPIFAEQTTFRLELPKGLKDASGRSLRNADTFPLKVSTGAMPPLAKFAAAPFGIVERLAEPGDLAVLPLTLRNVEPSLAIQGAQIAPAQAGASAPIGNVSTLKPMHRCRHHPLVPESAALRQLHRLPPALPAGTSRASCLRRWMPMTGRKCSRAWFRCCRASPMSRHWSCPALPSNDPRPFEVVGIPLPAGLSMWWRSHRKNWAPPCSTQRHGSNRTMVVRTSALVTNLGVHFKLGRENALAWVTTLDKGAPVADAQVRVSDCNGREDGQRQNQCTGHRVTLSGISPQPPNCNGEGIYTQAYFVSARATQPARRWQGHGGRHGLHLERLEPRHRALALQPAHQPGRASRRAWPTPFLTAPCCAPVKPCP